MSQSNTGKGPRNVQAKTAAYTVSVNDCGDILTNEAATAARLFSLPAATVGLWYDFVVKAAFELQIDPNGTETISLPTGVQQAAGKYIGADAVGEFIRIACVKAGEWTTLGSIGTWTAES